MPNIDVNGLDMFYTERGGGDYAIVFGHGLLMDSTMWDFVAPQFLDQYRVICFDFRGQGSTADPGHAYDIDSLVKDTAAFIQAISKTPVHYVGLSMGGMVGMPLAARHPALLSSLVLLDTSAQAEPRSNSIKYAMMTAVVKCFGVKPLVPRMLPLMFGRSFLTNPLNRKLVMHWTQKLQALKKTIVGPVSGVTKRRDVTHELAKIICPTLIIVGDEDTTTSVSCAENIAGNIVGSELKIIPQCGHSSALEQPDQIVALMKRFYAR